MRLRSSFRVAACVNADGEELKVASAVVGS